MLEAATGLRVEEVTSGADLSALVPEWCALWRLSPEATPFQTAAWLLPWWRHIGQGQLWTLAVREGDRLVGVIPLYVYTAPGETLRQVFLVGIATTDYLDGVFAPGYAQRAVAAALSHLDAARDRWDVCDFQQLRSGAALLCEQAPAGWTEAVEPHEPCPTLPLVRAADRDGLPEAVPVPMRRNLRYYVRRAERFGRVRIEAATAMTWRAHYEALLDLHRARWETRREAGVLADEGVRAAHRETVPMLLHRGLLRMYALHLGGRIAAVYYGLIDPPRPNRRAYYYLSGFDPECEGLSLGTLLVGHAVREAVCEGAVAFDFLRGREGYKYLWGAADEPTHRRRLWHG